MYCVLVGLSFWSTASPTIQTLDDVITLGLDTGKGDVQVKRGDKEPISITDLYNSIESLKTTVSQQSTLMSKQSTKIGELERCAKMGQAYDESIGDCIPVCQQLNQCAGVSCDDSTLGTQRMGAEAPEFCAESGWTELGGAHKGSTAQNPAIDCSDAQDGDKSVSGWYYIKDEVFGIRRRWCTMGGVGSARDDGGDGLTKTNPIPDCKFICVDRGVRPGFFYMDGGNLVQCLASGIEAVKGASPDFPAETCKGLDDGISYVTFGSGTPYKVTCQNQQVEIVNKGSAYSDRSWFISHSSNNNHWKCRCQSMSEIQGNTKDSWEIGQTTGGGGCQTYFTFGYETGGEDVEDIELLKLLAQQCKTKKNFGLLSYSCDDDGAAATGGHWFGVETARGSGSFPPRDCTSGEGGGGQSCPTCPTSNGGGCCEESLLKDPTAWETFPLLDKVCGSVNTGGGAGIGYTQDKLLCGAN